MKAKFLETRKYTYLFTEDNLDGKIFWINGKQAKILP